MIRRKIVVAVSLACMISASVYAAPPMPVTALPPPAAATPKLAGAPVVFEGKTLFHIREKALGVKPEDRARDSSGRLAKLVEHRMVQPGSIKVVDDDVATLVIGEGTVLVRAWDRDAAAEGITRQALAARYADRIREAIEEHNKAFSFRSLLIATIYAVAATVVLVFLLLLYQYVFPRIYAAIRAWGEARFRTIQIGTYELLHATRLIGFLITLVRWFRILTAVSLAYAWLLYVLSLFPWTRGISAAILGYILDPLRGFGVAVLAALPDLFVLAIIGCITGYFLKLARFFFDEVERGRIAVSGFYPDWAIPTFKIFRFFILAFALTVAFPYIPGSNLAAFKGVTIFLGVLFSLGSTSVISNVMGGVSITYMRAFKVGDRVRIGDTVGDVVGRSLLVTHLRTIKNEDVTVPNSMVLNAHIVNYSAHAKAEGLILHTSVTIGYDTPWRKVHELLLEAARRTPSLL
ncbi:MAG: mechanosensitive ion channel family protein, partial [Deltaproteobacteria bacterium]|nr:mechanosensitive ion channel domain-containing protein [Candidatus Deferrimicrobiaceae bacterium]